MQESEGAGAYDAIRCLADSGCGREEASVIVRNILISRISFEGSQFKDAGVICRIVQVMYTSTGLP